MDFAPPCLLIIDDEPYILELILSILACKNFKIDTANNGEDGIKKIELNRYGLILTDISMPRISGIQVLKYSRDILSKPTPIVGMSGSSWLLDENLFDGVLVKPFTVKELLRVVDHFLDE